MRPTRGAPRGRVHLWPLLHLGSKVLEGAIEVRPNTSAFFEGLASLGRVRRLMKSVDVCPQETFRPTGRQNFYFMHLTLTRPDLR